jgi:ribosomal protein S18 acetylase RimI-like enzyme
MLYMSENSIEDYLIEQFSLSDANFAEIARLVDSAFNPQNKGGTIAFDIETVRFMLGSPHLPHDLNVRVVYKPTGETVGFTGGIPRDLAWKERKYKFGVPTFQAVHKDHQRKGLAVKMNLKMIEVAKQLGFEGGFATYEPEEHGIDAILKVVKDHGLEMRQIFKIRQFVVRSWNIKRMESVVKLSILERIGLRFLQGLPKVKNHRVRKFRPEDGVRVFALMQDHIDRNDLSVVRNHDDFLWYINQPGVLCAVHEDQSGQVDGFILAWKMNLAGFGNMVPFGWLDIVHTYRLNIREATDLCKYFCGAAKDMGWVGIQTPFIPYFDPTPFKKAKFIFYPKKLLVNVYFLKKVEFPEKIERFYFDWR